MVMKNRDNTCFEFYETPEYIIPRASILFLRKFIEDGSIKVTLGSGSECWVVVQDADLFYTWYVTYEVFEAEWEESNGEA